MKVKVVLIEVSLMIFIFRISKEIKWKVKAVLLGVSLNQLNSWDIEEDQKERESCVNRIIIDELHCLDIQ